MQSPSPRVVLGLLAEVNNFPRVLIERGAEQSGEVLTIGSQHHFVCRDPLTKHIHDDVTEQAAVSELSQGGPGYFPTLEEVAVSFPLHARDRSVWTEHSD